MRLGSFLLFVSATVLVSCVLVFWALSEQSVTKAFDNVEVEAHRNIMHAVENRIETKKDYLTSLGSMLRFNYDFTGLYVVARETGDRVLVFEEIQRIAREGKLDAFQLIDPDRQIEFSIGPKSNDFPAALFDKKETRTGVILSDAGPVVVSVTPLDLYDDVVGYAVLGYQLERIREEVQMLYETPVSFDYTHPSSESALHKLSLSSGIDVYLSFPDSLLPARAARRTLRAELVAAGIAAFLLAILATYGLLEFTFVRKFDLLIRNIDEATHKLEQDDIPTPIRVDSFVTDVGKVSDSFTRFAHRIKQYRERYEEQARLSAEHSKRSALSELAQQVAHDIRSPLSSIDMLVLALDGIPSEKRALLKACVGRMHGIAEKLLGRFRGEDLAEENATIEPIVALCQSVIHEKELRCSAKLCLVASDDAWQKGFARVQAGEFRTLLSNLIDNALDASSASGDASDVVIRITTTDAKIRLCVEDKGPGIADDILPKLGERGATFGKKGGSGLGLHHARTMAKSWGGDLTIQSCATGPQRGTSVGIDLPLATAPAWLTTQLEFEPEAVVAVIDDDPAIHDRWRARLTGFDGLRLRHFMHSQELENWYSEEKEEASRAFLLCDMQIDERMSGLELIKTVGAQGRAVLVSGVDPDSEIREALDSLNIRFLPKTGIQTVGIRVLKNA